MASRPARTKRTVLAGAGRMGSAMMRGWLRNPRAAGLGELSVIEPEADAALKTLAANGAIRLNPEPEIADVVIVALKPQAFAAAASQLAKWCGPKTLVISIMAGAKMWDIGRALGVTRVVRAMPNTPGAIGQGVTAYCLSKDAKAADRTATQKLLAPLGEVVGPVDEDQMDAVTAVSGSGPAYVFLLAETLEAAARAAGLDAATAAVLARRTVAGAGALLAEGGDPTDLRKAVTSPGGTTAAALDVLLSSGAMPELMRRAVEAAVRRGAELSKG